MGENRIGETGIRRRDVLKGGLATGVGVLAGCISMLPSGANEDFDVDEVLSGLTHPWGLAFLPDESHLLVTERTGSLSVAEVEEDGHTWNHERLDGVPAVHAQGQGGLLDVEIHPEYPDEPWVYLTYVATNAEGDSTTTLGRGKLDLEADALVDFEVLHSVYPHLDSTNHFGSRVVFGDDGMVYVTTGDRGSKAFGSDHISQDRTSEHGSTLRLHPDGSIPTDNPFVEDRQVRDAIYSYGHRNTQGMTVHPETGDIWQSEHGEQDGDELNVLEAGGNYGWPIAHYGCTYGDGAPIGDEPDERDDVVDPVYYWECNSGGFPPAGMTFYDGTAFPEWQGDLFVGNLAGRYLGHFEVDGRQVSETDPLLADRGWRIRDVTVAPESDFLFVAVDDDDAPVVRLTPD